MDEAVGACTLPYLLNYCIADSSWIESVGVCAYCRTEKGGKGGEGGKGEREAKGWEG